MPRCHDHNLPDDFRARPAPFGIRVRLRPSDPLNRLLGDEWDKVHWFESERERDAALRDMARQHEYSRNGDEPTLIYEKITRGDMSE